MAHYILLFFVLISGGLFASAFFNQKFGKVLPITFATIAVILYFSGLFNVLLAGVIFVLAFSALLCIISFVHILRQKSFKEFAYSFATPTFFIFSFLFVFSAFFHEGMLAHAWDEFSHWADSIKVMFLTDDFITNPNSNSAFQSYPPIMSVFQYFFQKIIYILNPQRGFVESGIYFSYHLFSLSFFFPFLENEKKSFLKSVFVALLLFFLPTILFNGFYSSVYIDPFLSILSGCGFAEILSNEKNGTLHKLYIYSICFCLVLAKDVGLMFAVFISICEMINSISSQNFKSQKSSQKIRVAFMSILPLILSLIAKLTWNLELKFSNATISFEGTPNILNYTKMFFLKNDTTYKQTVVNNFKSAFFEGRTFGISYFHFSLVALMLTIAILVVIHKKNISKKQKNCKLFTLIVMVIQLAFYVYCLGATYVSNFTEYEALNLASYSRYMNIIYLSFFLSSIIFIVAHLTTFINNWKWYVPGILALSLVWSVYPGTSKFIKRTFVTESIEIREEYSEIIDDISSHCEDSSHIYFISQQDDGFDYWVTRYSVRPHLIDNAMAWSIGEKPFYQGDIWTANYSPEEIKQIFIEKNYNYLALYKVNNYFITNYSSLFESISEIENNSLFEFNKNTLLFERVDK